MNSSINIYFFIAGILCFILGIAHSILGEYLIFNPLRKKRTSIKRDNLFQKKHLGIIWATWHLASIFGFAFGWILIKFSSNENHILTNNFALPIILATGLSSFLVLYATKGRHPGWIVLMLIAILISFGK